MNDLELLMDTAKTLVSLIDEVIGLEGLATSYTDSTPLLGSVPRLDSMAVVSIIERVETAFGIEISDTELDASIFATVGTLTAFVRRKCNS